MLRALLLTAIATSVALVGAGSCECKCSAPEPRSITRTELFSRVLNRCAQLRGPTEQQACANATVSQAAWLAGRSHPPPTVDPPLLHVLLTSGPAQRAYMNGLF